MEGSIISICIGSPARQESSPAGGVLDQVLAHSVMFWVKVMVRVMVRVQVNPNSNPNPNLNPYPKHDGIS